MALDKPALRRLQEKRFGVSETASLKRRMLLDDLGRDKFLHGYLQRRFPHDTPDEQLDRVLSVYQNKLLAAPRTAAEPQATAPVR